MATTTTSKAQSSGAVPTRKPRRFSWNFSRTSFDLDPSAYQDSPIFIAPRTPPAGEPKVDDSPSASSCSQPTPTHESPRRVALRRRATVAIGAAELQGRLSDMSLETIVEEDGEARQEAKRAEADLDQSPPRRRTRSGAGCSLSCEGITQKAKPSHQ